MEGHQDGQGLEHVLCEVVDGGRLRDNGHKLRQKRFRLDKKKLFHDEDSRAVKVAVQRGCTLSTLGGFKEQPGLMSYLTLLWAGGWTRDLLQLLPTSFAL